MFSRLAIYVIVTGILVFFVDREADRGTLDSWESGYLSWLSGNSKRVPGKTDIVHLVIEDTDSGGGPGIFDQWPPSAIDYALILENLAVYAPRCVVVEPVLHWADGSDLTATILAEKASELQSLTLSCVLQNDPSAPDSGQPTTIPPPLPPTSVSGSLASVPEFTRTLIAPDQALLTTPSVSVGFTSIDLGSPPDSTTKVQLLAKNGGSVAPSLALTAMAAYYGVAPDDMEVEVGSHVSIGEHATIPIDQAGALTLPPDTGFEIQTVPADSLFLDTDSREIAGLQNGGDPLESIRDSLVVVGMSSPDELATLPATLATVQSAHYPTELDRDYQLGIWAALAFLGIILVARRRSLLPTILLLVLYTTTCLLTFGTATIWWPSAIPLTILATSLFLALLLPHPPQQNTTPAA